MSEQQKDKDMLLSTTIGIIGDVVLFIPRLITGFIRGIF
ncbi:hypothetical protein A33I_04035 [Alkalihalophilus marmarensis DSM 21297]|jgi:hypothetical protein|uniref:Uncharacterized protein n=1 Tax=Alkalihalophilus marmarensis DSM 21297 TaxID=1188261 RepID=U6SW28_9BACI|nr:hypothetical protein A33I_04035 [Alkalihalophilus marmarensis DSM 21297]